MNPDFLVIGAAKSGTTSMYNYLTQHPSIFMSRVKEPGFYAWEDRPVEFHGRWDERSTNSFAVYQRGEYEALFKSGEEAAIRGEASTVYLYSKPAARRIQAECPNMRLITILRNPVERAYATYCRLRRIGREPLQSFGEALDAERGRIERNWEPIWHYRAMGYYGEQLLRYDEALQDRRLLVVLHEDFDARPNDVLRDVFTFLGVSPDIPIDCSRRYNEGGAREPMQRKIRAALCDHYAKDIASLSQQLGRDLTHWVQVPQ